MKENKVYVIQQIPGTSEGTPRILHLIKFSVYFLF